jgi:predicted O-methyltransferase YrrM
VAKTFLDDALYDYILQALPDEHPVLAKLRYETLSLPEAGMQIAKDQGHFMALLAKLMDCKRYLEIGVFTGYSSLAVALAMGSEGSIDALDISEEYTSIARRYWKEAEVSDRIQLHLGPASETLKTLNGPYDLAFIDPDKPNIPHYFEECLRLVRPGGLILVDNVLWSGAVLQPDDQTPETRLFRHFNTKLKRDSRIDLCMLSIGDGLSLARKR